MVKALKNRLARDFQLAVLTLMGGIALVGITPFLVLRAVNHEWQAFFVDLLIVSVIFGCMLRAWMTGKNHGPSLFLGYFIGIAAIAAVQFIGAAGQYWFYPSVIACFFLVHRYHALGITLGSMLAVLVLESLNSTLTEAASFAITGVVCAFLGYAFAYRTEIQRQQLETLATKDALTGTGNRHALLEELERARRIHRRDHISFGILVLDLDNFKQINDCYGHLAGDAVLVTLVRLIEAQIRQNDRLFRYGGEEFVVLARDIGESALGDMADKLRKLVESHLRNPDGEIITTSIGGSVLRADESVDQWFYRADSALYVSKNEGRNRVTIDLASAS